MPALTFARRAAVVVLVSISTAASAQTRSPALAPGLWESEISIRINGQDMMAAMRAAQQEMLKSMPPSQRAQMEAMMKAQGGGPIGGRLQHCLTPEEAAKSTDSRQMLAQMHKDAPECRFQPIKTSGSTLSFKGRCEDPDGFTGDVSGEITIESAKSVVFRYEGKGRVSGAEDMPGVAGADNGPVHMLTSGRNRWIAADCGSVKPAPAR